jgi:hypothetical protein
MKKTDGRKSRDTIPSTSEQINDDVILCARRVQGLEEDLEKSEEKLLIANQKLDKVKDHIYSIISIVE